MTVLPRAYGTVHDWNRVCLWIPANEKDTGHVTSTDCQRTYLVQYIRVSLVKSPPKPRELSKTDNRRFVTRKTMFDNTFNIVADGTVSDLRACIDDLSDPSFYSQIQFFHLD